MGHLNSRGKANLDDTLKAGKNKQNRAFLVFQFFNFLIF